MLASTMQNWRISKDKHGIVDAEGYKLVVTADDEPAAGLILEQIRLMAAAPELLDALQRIVAINGCTGGDKALIAEFKHIARTAIAKAEGSGNE